VSKLKIVHFTASKLKIVHFQHFQPLSEDEEADRLDPAVDVECRTENTAEQLFCRWCARSHLFTFAAIGKAPSAWPGK